MTVQHNMPVFQAAATGEPEIEHPVAEHDEETMRQLRNPFNVAADGRSDAR